MSVGLDAAWTFFAASGARRLRLAARAVRRGARTARREGKAVARLGPEAAEPVDELLNAALAYAALHPPSLQGFLHWLRRSGAEVKREAEGAGSLVRVMTVHGAKGLQAPLVILPDTTSLPPDGRYDPMGDGSGLRARGPDLVAAAGIALRRRPASARSRRRAADGGTQSPAVRRADPCRGPAGGLRLAARRRTGRCVLVPVGGARLRQPCSADREAFGIWDGESLRHATSQTARARPGDAGRHWSIVANLPAWAGKAPDWRAEPPPPEPERPERLRPSRPEGAELGPVPAVASPLATREPASNRFRRGKLIHALLQHLPDLPVQRRATAARAWLDRPGHGLAAGDADLLVAETLAILDHPELAAVFGPGSRAEVPLTGVIAGSVVGGLVDRLAVLADRVLMADFKTNRRPPGAHRGHASAVSAPDGRLSRRAARNLPRPRRSLRAGLDPGGGGRHPARRIAGDPRSDQAPPGFQPCTRRCLIHRYRSPPDLQP